MLRSMFAVKAASAATAMSAPGLTGARGGAGVAAGDDEVALLIAVVSSGPPP